MPHRNVHASTNIARNGIRGIPFGACAIQVFLDDLRPATSLQLTLAETRFSHFSLTLPVPVLLMVRLLPVATVIGRESAVGIAQRSEQVNEGDVARIAMARRDLARDFSN